jgi:hypothetical protein
MERESKTKFDKKQWVRDLGELFDEYGILVLQDEKVVETLEKSLI